jgi:hypothetical protein
MFEGSRAFKRSTFFIVDSWSLCSKDLKSSTTNLFSLRGGSCAISLPQDVITNGATATAQKLLFLKKIIFYHSMC